MVSSGGHDDADTSPTGPAPRDRTIDANLEIRPFEPDQAQAWQQYVSQHPAATVFHEMGWSRAVEAAYRHQPMHLTAWSQGRLAGVLPLFVVKSLFVGTVLVSLPYATYGGMLVDSLPVASAMLEAVQDMVRGKRGRYAEFRNREPVALDLHAIDRYDTFRRQLPARGEDVLEWLPRKARAAARKGRSLLRAEIGPQWLDAIYDLYAYTLRRLGSPNYRRRFFHELARQYGDRCVCLAVLDGERPVAGVVSFVFRDEITPYFSGSRPEGLAKCANNFMYLRLMEHAVESGLRVFDFNRTRRDNKGPHDFKRFQGFQPSPLHYQLWLNEGCHAPNLSPSNSRFRMAGRVWRHMPLWLTRTAGGTITKWIP